MPAGPHAAAPDAAPIIFIHYGDAGYLRHTLAAARRSNPGKRIILLGDPTNRHFAGPGITHHDMADFAAGSLISTFDKVFQLIKGDSHNYRKLKGADFWTRFVFRRWFIIQEFITQQNITKFWTFDSDTLILAPLAPREARFATYDCTEQCRGKCLNGFIPSATIVRRYVERINELFQRPAYLEEQRVFFRTHKGLAFTEMSAYETFRTEDQLNTFHLALPVDGEAFDDALCFTENFAVHPEKIKGRLAIKDLHLHPAGAVFATEHSSQEQVRLLTLNLSWMPDYIFRRLAACASDSAGPLSKQPLQRLDLQEPLGDIVVQRVRNMADRTLKWLRADAKN